MKGQRIQDIKKRFKKEWLLIRVTEFDKNISTCLKGQLLAHSPHRDEIFRKSMNHKGHDLVVFSEDKLPKGYAIVF